MAKNKEIKTNAMRILDSMKISPFSRLVNDCLQYNLCVGRGYILALRFPGID